MVGIPALSPGRPAHAGGPHDLPDLARPASATPAPGTSPPGSPAAGIPNLADLKPASPRLRYDPLARLSIIVYLDAASGEVLRQIPAERVVEHYRSNAALRGVPPRLVNPNLGTVPALPADPLPEEMPQGNASPGVLA